MKNFANFTDEELRKELEDREKIAYEKAIKKIKSEETKRKKKISKIEKQFEADKKSFYDSLESSRQLITEAEKIFIESAEKYGFPVNIDNDTYWPKSMVKWQNEDVFSQEELTWLDEQFSCYPGHPNTKPGEWWVPSAQNCY